MESLVFIFIGLIIAIIVVFGKFGDLFYPTDEAETKNINEGASNKFIDRIAQIFNFISSMFVGLIS